MLTYHVKRDTLKLPEAGAAVHPDTYMRVIKTDQNVTLENASLEDIAIEKDRAGRAVRRTLMLKDVRPDPNDKNFVFCDVEEMMIAVTSYPDQI